MQEQRNTRSPRFFYGYWVLLVAFTGVFFMSGAGFYSFSLFIKPLASDLGWSRGGIMAGLTTFSLVMALVSPMAGKAIDRFGARTTVILGAFISGIGFIWLSKMQVPWHYYVSYALIGTGIAGYGQIAATAVVSNWFKKRRGLAIGIMTTGVGAGGFVFASLIGGYVIPTFDWRSGYITLAVLTFVVIIPMALFLLKTRPADMGLQPDGATIQEESSTESPGTPSTGITLSKATGRPEFWLLGISFLFHGFSQAGVFQNQVPHMQDIGITTAMAATILGTVGIGSTVGKFGFGWICDHIRAKWACVIGIGLQILGTILLINASPTLAWLYAITMGLGIGAYLPTMSILTSRHFGLSNYGSIFGAMTFFWFLGCGISPILAGYLYDTKGSYFLPLVIFLISYVLSFLAILMLRKPRLNEQSNSMV